MKTTDDSYTIGNQSFFVSDGRDHSSVADVGRAAAGGVDGRGSGVGGGGGDGRGGGNGVSASRGYNRGVCHVYDIEHTKYRKPQWYVDNKQQHTNIQINQPSKQTSVQKRDVHILFYVSDSLSFDNPTFIFLILVLFCFCQIILPSLPPSSLGTLIYKQQKI